MTNEARPEPGDAIERIREGLGWGPINTTVAVNAGFRCEYCDRDLLGDLESYYSWQIDRITPGVDYAIDDCALCCRTCNHLKHDRKPLGNTRAERIADARRDIGEKRERKQRELDRLRAIIGQRPSARVETPSEPPQKPGQP